MDKDQLADFLLNAISNSPLAEILRTTNGVLSGDYLGGLIFNELYQLTIRLAKPTIYKLNNGNYHKVFVSDNYTIIEIQQDTPFNYTNFNSILAKFDSDTNNLKVTIDNSFIELFQTKQLEITRFNPPGKALVELIKLSNTYKGVLYADINKAIAMLNDLTSVVNFKGLAISYKDVETVKSINYLDIEEIIPVDYPGTTIPVIKLPKSNLLPPYLLNAIKGLKGVNCFNRYLMVVKYLYGSGVKKSTRETRLIVLNYPELFSFALLTPNYLDNLPNNWKAKLPALNKFLGEHDLLPIFSGKTLPEQIRLLDELRQLIKQYGLWIIGLLEQHLHHYQYNKQEFIKLIEFKKLENSKWLVKPLKLPELPFGLKSTWKVVELHTRQQLIQEGEYQRHCVGGYTVSETHRIWSLRKDNLRYTVEVSYYNSTWRVNQARGRHNSRIESYDEVTQRDLNILVTWLISSIPRPADSILTIRNPFN
jgi:hypothetical protein